MNAASRRLCGSAPWPTPISICNISEIFPLAGVGGGLGGARCGCRQPHTLRRVSLEVSTGALHFLLCPLDCGKTKFLRIFAGFTEPDADEVAVLGSLNIVAAELDR